MVLPAFDEYGLLPAGDFPLTIDQLRESFLVTGPAEFEPTWDSVWRKQLVENLAILARQLWDVGVADIFIDGSFVECKGRPNDIDGYFHCDEGFFGSGELELALNRLDPFDVWTWDPARRSAHGNDPKRQLPMWHQYRIELYPEYGQLCGIRDAFGNPLQFPSAFRQSRDGGRRKGIVRLLRGQT